VRLKLPRLRPVVEFITLLPLVIPPIVIVFGYIRMFNTSSILPLTGTAAGTGFLPACGYATLALPYMLRLKFQVQHPRPTGHRMLRWTDEASTSAARNVA
jgi:ABC-type Fe3+ transport system permease subunit